MSNSPNSIIVTSATSHQWAGAVTKVEKATLGKFLFLRQLTWGKTQYISHKTSNHKKHIRQAIKITQPVLCPLWCVTESLNHVISNNSASHWNNIIVTSNLPLFLWFCNSFNFLIKTIISVFLHLHVQTVRQEAAGGWKGSCPEGNVSKEPALE